MSQMSSPLHRSLHRLRMAFWQRRAIHWFVRTVWLTLLVPLFLFIGYFWQGWEIGFVNLFGGMFLVAGLSMLWAIRPIRLQKIVQRLDQRLELQARLKTAVEYDKPDVVHSNPVAQKLIQETVQIITAIRSRIQLLNEGFWLETRTLIAVSMLLAGFIVLNNINPTIPDAAVSDLPPAWNEPSADDILPPNNPPPPPDASNPEDIRGILEILADEFRDEAPTRPTADALDIKDTSKAAEELRRLADRLDQLSRDSQTEIGASMLSAAIQIGSQHPEIPQILSRGNDAIQQEDIIAAEKALEDLADAIENLDINPPPPEQEPPPPEPENPEDENSEEPPPPEENENPPPPPPPPPPEEERLAGEGDPLEIEVEPIEDRVLQQAELEVDAGDETTEDSPFARQSTISSGDLGPDPLTYPWGKREVIRSYFTPE